MLFFQSRHEPRDKSLNLSEPQFLQEKMEEILLILASPAWSMGEEGREVTCGILALQFQKIPKGNYGANDSEMKGAP